MCEVTEAIVILLWGRCAGMCHTYKPYQVTTAVVIGYSTKGHTLGSFLWLSTYWNEKEKHVTGVKVFKMLSSHAQANTQCLHTNNKEGALMRAHAGNSCSGIVHAPSANCHPFTTSVNTAIHFIFLIACLFIGTLPLSIKGTTHILDSVHSVIASQAWQQSFFFFF